MKKSGLIVVIIVILVIAGGAFALTRKPKDTPVTTTPTTTPSTSNTSNTTTQTTTPTTDTSAQATTADTTITFDGNGFSPATLTVKAGTTVTIKNTSKQLLQFDSDPHPTHTDDPEINVGVVSAGQSKTVKVTKTGSHGYHNHLSPNETGTLVVQ